MRRCIGRSRSLRGTCQARGKNLFRRRAGYFVLFFVAKLFRKLWLHFFKGCCRGGGQACGRVEWFWCFFDILLVLNDEKMIMPATAVCLRCEDENHRQRCLSKLKARVLRSRLGNCDIFANLFGTDKPGGWECLIAFCSVVLVATMPAALCCTACGLEEGERNYRGCLEVGFCVRRCALVEEGGDNGRWNMFDGDGYSVSVLVDLEVT